MAREEIQTRNWTLRHANNTVGFILEDKRTGQLTYFDAISGGFFYKTNGVTPVEIQNRSGRVPDDLPNMIQDELDYIKEFGEMRGPDSE